MGSTICYTKHGRKSHQDLGCTICCSQELARKRVPGSQQYDLLRPRVGQKQPPRLGSAICYGQKWARKSHRNSVIRFVTAQSWPKRATKTRQYDLLRLRIGQKKPRRLGSTICCGQEQYNLLRPRVGQKKPPRLGSTISYGQDLARKSHQYPAI